MQQRANITKVVADLSRAVPSGRRAVKRGKRGPIEAPPPESRKRYTKKLPSTAKPWYVVIDEIVEETVTFEAWPWPQIDETTNFLRFELDKRRSRTMDIVDLQKRVNQLREETEEASVAHRPLRIGDVFEVHAKTIKDLTTWRKLTDDTERKRKEARAALHAMAAPVLDAKTAATLEKLARNADPDAPDPTAQRGPGAQAFPAV